MCDLKKLLKDKIKLEVQIKHIDEKIKLILEEKEFKEEVIKNEFKVEFKVDFEEEEEEEEEERIVGDIEELEKELSEFKEINLDLELEKETFTDEFIPAFENPNDGFEVKNIPYSDGVENLSTLFDNKDFKTNNFFK
jgi:hypothetical protein